MRKLLSILIFLPCLTVSAGSDTTRIVALNDKALEIAYTNPDEAMKLADKALLLSRKSGFKRGEVRALIRKGIVYDIQTKNELAISMYRKSLVIAEETNDLKGAASNLNNLGLICYKVSKYADALNYFTQAYAIFLELKDEENLGFVANNIGLLHAEMERYPRALKFYRQALEHYSKANNKDAFYDVYSNIGSSFELMKSLDSALIYSEKAVEGYRRNGDKYSLGISLGNLGTLYFALKDSVKANVTLLEARKYAKEVGNIFSYTSSTLSLAGIKSQLKKNDDAYLLLKEAFQLLPECQSNELGYKICNNLVEHEMRRGDKEKALKYLYLYQKYHSAYSAETTKKNYAEMEQRFSLKEEQRRSEEVILVEKERHFRETVFWASGVILLIFSGLLVFFIIRKRNLQKQLENQQAVFEATMEERKRISYDLHDHVGSQLSYVVNNLELIGHENQKSERISRTFAMSQAAMSSLRDTVWALHTEELTVEILAQRMENVALKTLEQAPEINFDMQTNVSSESLISAQNTLHVMRIFQEALHNVIKHAHASEIEVLFDETETGFELIVRDNGDGFSSGDKKPFHYGLQSMKDRAAKISGKVEFLDPETGTGVVLKLHWPKNNSIA